MSKALLFGVCCIISLQAYTQISVPDSLLIEAHKTNNNNTKLDIILKACSQNDINLDTFIRYAFIAQNLAQQSKDKNKMAYAAYYVAYAYYLANSNDSARIAINNALQYVSADNEANSKIYYKLKGFLATTYQGQRNNAAALKILYPLLEEAEKHKDSLFVAQTMHQIAIIEGQQNNPEKLIAWEKKALMALPAYEENTAIILATIYATMGKAFLEMNSNDSATYYHLVAIALFRKNNDLYNLAIVLQRQANVFINQKQKKKAGQILNELAQLNNRIGMGEGDVNYHLTFANFYLLSKEYDKTIALAREHLYGNKAIGNANIRMSYLKTLAAAYKAKADLKMYGATLEELLDAREQFYKTNSADAIAEMQTRYEVQKKENTIIKQKLDLVRKNFLFVGSLIVLGLGVVIVLLLFRSYQRKNRMKLLLIQEEEKRNALLAVKNAEEKERKRIAADLHDSLGSYAASIKANADEMWHEESITKSNLELLQTNSQQMVSLLADTIWALKKESLHLSDISDRIKLFLQRLRPNYPTIKMNVLEDIGTDVRLPPANAYHLFMIVQEAVNNSIRHSEADEILVSINSNTNWWVAIKDNGKGITKKTSFSDGGNGMYNMKARAANMDCSIQWVNVHPQGTEVIIRNNTF